MKGTILKTDRVLGAKSLLLFWNLNYFDESFIEKYKKKTNQPTKRKEGPCSQS